MKAKDKAKNMKDEEKARELSVNYKVTLNDVQEGFQEQIVEQACMRMADWKDIQFKTIIDVVIEQFNQYPDNAVFRKSNMIDLLIEIKKVIGE